MAGTMAGGCRWEEGGGVGDRRPGLGVTPAAARWRKIDHNSSGWSRTSAARPEYRMAPESIT